MSHPIPTVQLMRFYSSSRLLAEVHIERIAPFFHLTVTHPDIIDHKEQLGVPGLAFFAAVRFIGGMAAKDNEVIETITTLVEAPIISINDQRTVLENENIDAIIQISEHWSEISF